MENGLDFLQLITNNQSQVDEFIASDSSAARLKNAAFLSPVHIQLTAHQQEAISNELTISCSGLCQETMPNQLADHAADILRKYVLPECLVKISLFQQTGASPYLQIKNLVSTNNLPPTPSDDSVPEGKNWRIQAAALLGMMRLCKLSPASFLDEMGGRLYHMVMPASNNRKSFLRSTKALNFHTEVVNGYFVEDNPAFGAPISPGAFGLICFRNPDSIPTTILPLSNILHHLDDETIVELMKHNYTAISQSSFDRDIIIDNVPVLKNTSNGLLGIRYSHSKLKGRTIEANKALIKLKTIIEHCPSYSLALEPGDAIIINNRICLHGRSKVPTSERFDGNNRWLVRIYGYDEKSLQAINFDLSQQYAMIVNEETYD